MPAAMLEGDAGDAGVPSAPTFRFGLAKRCTLGAEVCCGESAEFTRPLTSYTCQDMDSTCAGANVVRVECTSSADCLAIGAPAGAVCCVSHSSPGGKVHGTSCAVSTALCNEPEQRLACDPSLGSGARAPDASCQPGPYDFSQYFECQ
jgi:hypothetical protein